MNGRSLEYKSVFMLQTNDHDLSYECRRLKKMSNYSLKCVFVAPCDE